MTSTTTPRSLDQTTKARELIEIWLTLDIEAQDSALARLIAAAIHPGQGSALERFAGTGSLDGQAMLHELNQLQVPLEREHWLDTLGRHVLLHGGRS